MNLHQKARLFNAWIVEDAMDEYGLIRHRLTYPERRPIPWDMLEHVRRDRQTRQAEGKKWHPLAGTPAYAMYEDANYVGNRYLNSQVWRWLATGTAESRDNAQQGFSATLYPFREGIKREKGYWPKPYGALKGDYAIDRSYTETSVDQAYSPMIALWRFHQHLASPSQRREIAEAMQAHGHWWIRHDYGYAYLGETWRAFGERIASPSAALKIPIGMHMAYRLTGDPQLRDECVRIIRKAQADGAFQMHEGPRGEIKDLYHWAEMYAYFLRETELADLTDWAGLIRECWRYGKSTMQGHGLCIGMGEFRPEGYIVRYTPGPIDDVHHGYWKTDAPHPASTAQMAGLAMLVHELDLDRKAGETGRELLAALSPTAVGDLHGYLFARPDQMPPAIRDHPPPLLFNTRTVVFWLEAYWRGRLHGVLGSGD